MADIKAFSDMDINKVDPVAHVNSTDNFFIQATVNGKAKIRRAAAGKVLDRMLAETGLALDDDGQLCAVISS